MITSESLKTGDLPEVKVGIGCAPGSRFVETSVRAMDNPNVIVYTDPKALADDLASGKIAAAVRGDMSSSELLPLIKKALGLDHLERVVLLGVRGRVVVSLPVGIDEGWSAQERIEMTERAVKLVRRLGLENPRIAVMSGGRTDDRGRCAAVDRTLDDAEEITSALKSKGYDAYDAQILIEEAIDHADILVAPDGITGNLIFRTTHFIGGVEALGAPVVNSDKVFVDTSRVKTDFSDSIAVAMKLAGMRQ